MGSPPRMRERLEVGHNLCVLPRITPAYAGKTSSYILLPSANKDHPRVCGKDS